MSLKKYIVNLSEEERIHLSSITKTGRHAAAKIIHARILLAADIGEFSSEQKTDSEIAKFLDVNILQQTSGRKNCGQSVFNFFLIFFYYPVVNLKVLKEKFTCKKH